MSEKERERERVCNNGRRLTDDREYKLKRVREKI